MGDAFHLECDTVSLGQQNASQLYYGPSPQQRPLNQGHCHISEDLNPQMKHHTHICQIFQILKKNGYL